MVDLKPYLQIARHRILKNLCLKNYEVIQKNYVYIIRCWKCKKEIAWFYVKPNGWIKRHIMRGYEPYYSMVEDLIDEFKVKQQYIEEWDNLKREIPMLCAVIPLDVTNNYSEQGK